MKQYMPLNSVKRGFKLWVVADSTNGYFFDVQVYIGREGGSNRAWTRRESGAWVDRKGSGEKPPHLL